MTIAEACFKPRIYLLQSDYNGIDNIHMIDLDKIWMFKEGISYVIPYKKRGKKVIENWDEALQAAINMSKDLS